MSIEKMGTIRKLLDKMGILGELEKENEDNFITIASLTKNLIKKKERCKETIIYRIAMTLYHSGRYWDNHVFKLFDDPMSIFLKLSTNYLFQKEYPKIWESISNNKQDRLVKANQLKTLICFLISTYFYYKNEEEINE